MEQNNLIYGLIASPPYYYVSDFNEIIGRIGVTVRNLNYFVLNTFNCTLKNISRVVPSTCDDSGHCTGILGDLQTGLYDYAGFFADYQISGKMSNITLGPFYNQYNCFFLYSPQFQSNQIMSTAFSSLQSFSTQFWFLLISFAIILALLLSFVRPKISCRKWIVIFFEYSFGQNFTPISSAIQKFCLISFLATIFSVGAIFSAALQIGLTTMFDFVHVNTFQDIVSQNRITFVLRNRECDNVIKLLNHPLAQRVVETFQFLTFTGSDIISPLLNAMADHVHGFLGYEFSIVRLLAVLYASSSPPVKKNLAYTASKPLTSVSQFILVSNHVSSKVLGSVIKYGYAAFEMSASCNHKMKHIDALSLVGKYVDPDFLTLREPTIESITTPLSILYMKPILYSCFVVFIFLTGLLLLELKLSQILSCH